MQITRRNVKKSSKVFLLPAMYLLFFSHPLMASDDLDFSALSMFLSQKVPTLVETLKENNDKDPICRYV